MREQRPTDLNGPEAITLPASRRQGPPRHLVQGRGASARMPVWWEAQLFKAPSCTTS